ncbi:MAG: energy-coupling factor transporter transmembrane protein EcfT [Clostridiales bacterium]|nr:energy-coupling factor transporter transmembrane protein EcfT [Clostridiales bacterium]
MNISWKVNKLKDTFATYHPIINFIYFCAVIVLSMLFLHPIFLAITIAGSLTYSISLNGRKGLRQIAIYLVPMMILAALINPLFNHRGVTIIGYFNNNPITLESIYYGIAVGIMFGSVILWFSCFYSVFTTDKLTYLFGRVAPSLSLILSMVLRFVPRFKTQLRIITNGQKCLGRNVTDGTVGQRVKNGIKILSIMISWALENSIETADSMKSRGYGLPGRTSFSIYRFDARDKIALLVLIILIVLISYGALMDWYQIQYFPSIKVKYDKPAIFAIYFALCFAPTFLNIWEAIKWKRLKSKI